MSPSEPSLTVEELLDRLEDPDLVGSSEYRALHELVETVAASAAWDGEGPLGAVLSSLEELEACITVVRANLRHRPESA